MLVSDLGEFALIDRLAKSIESRNNALTLALEAQGSSLALGIGDDAAVWSAGSGLTVATTDTMVEGSHFLTDQIGWRDLGWKAIATNSSDVGAMGCRPTFALVTLGLHGDLPVEGLVEMYAGMMDALEYAGGIIAGGDVVKSPVFFVTVALEGQSMTIGNETPLLRRGKAAQGDLVAVTGPLGCSGGGLRLALDDSESGRLSEEDADHLKLAHNHPYPRVAEGIALARAGVKSAMDISDGLLDDLGKLCKESGVGAIIRASDVPADAILRSAFPDDWLGLALGGGEDYELLFTAPPDVMKIAIREVDAPISVIGEIQSSPSGVTVVDESNSPMTVGTGGWDHFEQTS
ncbi:MAG: thiamine-phosphate kinase [SAR202 cluster bacterium]|jgi:thiamine-monophosphate kinase|nr:thiamine-phosphate kinase [SAR202 cluster bacterium]MDP6714748.1 thiamine-phosphate kinase [SAR202 cluster bacterium]